MSGARDFAQISAQVIPVLLLALLVDPRNREPSSGSRPNAAQLGASGRVLLGLILGVVAEITALSAITRNYYVNVLPALAVLQGLLAAVLLLPHALFRMDVILDWLPARLIQVMIEVCGGVGLIGLIWTGNLLPWDPLWLKIALTVLLIPLGLISLYAIYKGKVTDRTQELWKYLDRYRWNTPGLTDGPRKNEDTRRRRRAGRSGQSQRPVRSPIRHHAPSPQPLKGVSRRRS